MAKKKKILRLISLAVVSSFILQDTSLAAEFKPTEIAYFAHPGVSLDLPKSVALTGDTFKGTSSKTLVLVQDAHTNESAQLHIAQALESILKSQKMRFVFLEAADGINSLAIVRDKAPLDKRKQVAREYLRKGVLDGSEYLDMTSNAVFIPWGVEDKDLYWRALKNYEKVAKGREKFQAYLRQAEVAVEILKPRVFNPPLAAFDMKHQAFLREKMPLTDYLEVLIQESGKKNAAITRIPHLLALSALKDKEKTIDFIKANQEQLQAVSLLSDEDKVLIKEADSNEDANSPFKLSGKDHKTQKAFYALLEEKIKDSAAYPELSKYFEYLRAADKIDAKAILEEQKLLEAEVYAYLIRTDDERDMRRADEALRFLRSLFDLTVMPDEFNAYKADRSSFDIEALTGFLNRKIMDLKDHYDRVTFLEQGYDDYVKSAEEFYQLTYERDVVFVDRALSMMEKTGDTKAALITGGYHTPNLSALLKEKNVSFIVVTPQVLQETNRKKYENQLLSQTEKDIDISPKPLKNGADTIAVFHSIARQLQVLAQLRVTGEALALSRGQSLPAFSGARLSAGDVLEQNIVAADERKLVILKVVQAILENSGEESQIIHENLPGGARDRWDRIAAAIEILIGVDSDAADPINIPPSFEGAKHHLLDVVEREGKEYKTRLLAKLTRAIKELSGARMATISSTTEFNESGLPAKMTFSSGITLTLRSYDAASRTIIYDTKIGKNDAGVYAVRLDSEGFVQSKEARWDPFYKNGRDEVSLGAFFSSFKRKSFDRSNPSFKGTWTNAIDALKAKPLDAWEIEDLITLVRFSDSIRPVRMPKTERSRYSEFHSVEKAILATGDFRVTAILDEVDLGIIRQIVVRQRSQTKIFGDTRYGRDNLHAVSLAFFSEKKSPAGARLSSIEDIRRALASTRNFGNVPILYTGPARIIDADQIKTPSPDKIKTLTPDEIRMLPLDQIDSLLNYQIRALSSAQIRALTAIQMQSISIEGFAPLQLGALTPEQLKNALYSDHRIRVLSMEHIQALLPGQLTNLTKGQLEALLNHAEVIVKEAQRDFRRNGPLDGREVIVTRESSAYGSHSLWEVTARVKGWVMLNPGHNDAARQQMLRQTPDRVLARVTSRSGVTAEQVAQAVAETIEAYPGTWSHSDLEGDFQRFIREAVSELQPVKSGARLATPLIAALKDALRYPKFDKDTERKIQILLEMHVGFPLWESPTDNTVALLDSPLINDELVNRITLDSLTEKIQEQTNLTYGERASYLWAANELVATIAQAQKNLAASIENEVIYSALYRKVEAYLIENPPVFGSGGDVSWHLIQKEDGAVALSVSVMKPGGRDDESFRSSFSVVRDQTARFVKAFNAHDQNDQKTDIVTVERNGLAFADISMRFARTSEVFGGARLSTTPAPVAETAEKLGMAAAELQTVLEEFAVKLWDAKKSVLDGDDLAMRLSPGLSAVLKIETSGQGNDQEIRLLIRKKEGEYQLLTTVKKPREKLSEIVERQKASGEAEVSAQDVLAANAAAFMAAQAVDAPNASIPTLFEIDVMSLFGSIQDSALFESQLASAVAGFKAAQNRNRVLTSALGGVSELDPWQQDIARRLAADNGLLTDAQGFKGVISQVFDPEKRSQLTRPANGTQIPVQLNENSFNGWAVLFTLGDKIVGSVIQTAYDPQSNTIDTTRVTPDSISEEIVSYIGQNLKIKVDKAALTSVWLGKAEWDLVRRLAFKLPLIEPLMNILLQANRLLTKAVGVAA